LTCAPSPDDWARQRWRNHAEGLCRVDGPRRPTSIRAAGGPPAEPAVTELIPVDEARRRPQRIGARRTPQMGADGHSWFQPYLRHARRSSGGVKSEAAS
jgi:hypothetical protein